jgi:hypothetical protein
MSEWIDWAGGECPVPDGATEVEVRYVADSDGEDAERMTGDQARELHWSHTGGIGDIVAYRVLSAPASAKPSNPKDIVGVRKAPMSTVSGPVLAEVGVAMLEGAAKYGRHNYRAVGVRSSVYYDATMRHLIGWWEGEDTDPDSGLSHITKAITSLVVLRDAMLQDKVEDDRPPRAKTFYPGLNARAAAMLDKHADKSPHHYTLKDAL